MDKKAAIIKTAPITEITLIFIKEY